MSAVLSGSFQLFSCLLHIENWTVQNGSNDQKAKDKLLHRSCYDNGLEIRGGKSSTIQILNKRMKTCALILFKCGGKKCEEVHSPHSERFNKEMNYFTNRGCFGYNIIELFGCSLLKKTTQDPELWLLLFSRATIFVHHMFPARVPSGLQHLIVKLAWQTCKVQLVSNM